MAVQKHWYGVYTCSRWEKKVDLLLKQKGIESYCPLNKVERQWSDRKKLVEEPLFTSYVFVRISEEEMPIVRLVRGIVNFIYWLGKPAVILDRDIDAIRRFLGTYDHVTVEPLEFAPDDQVKVRIGIFTDQTGKVIRVGKKKVEVRIDSLGCDLVAWVDKKTLQLMEEKKLNEKSR